MGLKIKNAATAHAMAEAPLQDTEAASQLVDPALVQEYVELVAKLDKHDAKVKKDRKRADDLKKMMVAEVDAGAQADETVELHGTDGKATVEVSAKTEVTTLTDLALAKKFLGTETFLKVAKITLTDLRDYLTKPQLEQVTETDRIGSRRLKVS